MFKLENKKATRLQISEFNKYASIFVIGLVAVFSAYLYWQLMLPRKDFYNNLWGPAYLLAHGKSPYDTASLAPELPAVWLPMVIGAFFPLGWFSESVALQVWFIVNILELCMLVYFIQGNKQSLSNTVILALLCFFFPFVLNNFILGQFSITAMLCMLLSALFAENRRDWLTAGFLALALSKPQLGIIAVFGLSVFYFQRNGFLGIIHFGLKTFLMTSLMCLPLFIAYPAWIPDWITSLQANHAWQHPSLFSILRESIGIGGVFIWLVILLLALFISYQTWTKFPPRIAMLWSLGLTTLVTPYVWSWDFVLLLPILLYTFVQVGWMRKVILLSMYAIAWYGMAMIQLRTDGHERHYWWVPFFFMAVMTLVTDWKTIQITEKKQITGDELSGE